MTERQADAVTQLEIDSYILDYLAFSAIRALLDDCQTPYPANGASKADIPLQLVDCKPD